MIILVLLHHAGIKSHIGKAVAHINLSFKKSKINAKVRLVGTGKMNYDSKGNLSAAMGKLRKDSAAKALRNSKKADLVSMMVTGSSGGAAGLGSVMPSSKGNAAACYSVVHEKFEELAKKAGMPAAEVAEGFLDVAANTMARAIKKVSVERGQDPKDFALASFGGAAGQHACLVADALGITKIFFHPFSNYKIS